MGKIKGTTVVAGLVIAGLLGSNAYAYMELNETKEEVNEYKEGITALKEEINIAVSHLNKSTSYASHEDIIASFNSFSASKGIQYEGKYYFADIKSISAHSYNEKEKVQYVANAEMTFLEDRMENGVSYIQNELPKKLLSTYLKVTEDGTGLDHSHEGQDEHEGHGHDEGLGLPEEVISVSKMTEIEKEAKEEFVVHSWSQELTFNMEGQVLFQPTKETEVAIFKEFAKSVILKDKGLINDNAVVEMEGNKLTVKAEGKSFTFTYNPDTQQLVEIK